CAGVRATAAPGRPALGLGTPHSLSSWPARAQRRVVRVAAALLGRATPWRETAHPPSGPPPARRRGPPCVGARATVAQERRARWLDPSHSQSLGPPPARRRAARVVGVPPGRAARWRGATHHQSSWSHLTRRRGPPCVGARATV